MNKLTQNSASKKQGQGEQVWLTRNQFQEYSNWSEGKIRSERKNFTTRLTKGNGGFQYEFLLSSLPIEIQEKHLGYNPENNSDLPIITTQSNSLVHSDRTYLSNEDFSQYNELSKKDELIAVSRANLVLQYIDAYSGKSGKKKHQIEFVKSYNLNLLSFENIYSVIGEATFQTLNRWRKIYLDANKDFRVLAPNYQKSRKDKIPEIQEDILLKTVLNPNKILPFEAIRFCIAEFKRLGHEKICSDRTYARFLKNWKSENLDKWTLYREGMKSLNDNVIPSFRRDRNLVEVGDIIVGDGHVLNFRIVDPFDGKMKRAQLIIFQDFRSGFIPGYDISFSENSNAIKTALFRSMLTLGKNPQVVYFDNGKAFNSKLFTDSRGIFERFGIRLINAIAYAAQSKPIERFFRSFGELERRISSYVGTSIKDKPAHLLRGEKLHREIHQKLNHPIVDYYTAYNAIAQWLDEFHSRPTKALNGKTPKEIFEAGKGPGVNKLQLMFLMMHEDNKKIKRGTIKLFGEDYVSDHFYGIEKEIMVKYDLIDLKASGTVYCFDSKDRKFICTAKRKTMLHPAAGILGTENDVRELELQLKNRSKLKGFTTKDARTFLQNEIIPTVKKQVAVAELEREKLAAEEIKRTGTDDFYEVLSVKTVRSKKEKTRSWI